MSHRVLSWDYREQPDLDDLAAAIRELTGSSVHLTQVATESDQYAIVLADRPLGVEDAFDLYAKGWS